MALFLPARNLSSNFSRCKRTPRTPYNDAPDSYLLLSDMSSKSANYCFPSTSQPEGLLLLCEVSLGKQNELLNADMDADKLPKGKHSVKGVGKTSPQPENFTKLSDGTIIPMGKLTM